MYERFFSTVFRPIPLTWVSLSAVWNEPCCLRQATIALALEAPMLISDLWIASASAVLMLTFCPVFLLLATRWWVLDDPVAVTMEALLAGAPLLVLAWAPPISSSESAIDWSTAETRFMGKLL